VELQAVNENSSQNIDSEAWSSLSWRVISIHDESSIRSYISAAERQAASSNAVQMVGLKGVTSVPTNN
jgi:hypothetical protein